MDTNCSPDGNDNIHTEDNMYQEQYVFSNYEQNNIKVYKRLRKQLLDISFLVWL